MVSLAKNPGTVLVVLYENKAVFFLLRLGVCVFDPCEEEASVLRDGIDEMTRAFGLDPNDVRPR